MLLLLGFACANLRGTRGFVAKPLFAKIEDSQIPVWPGVSPLDIPGERLDHHYDESHRVGDVAMNDVQIYDVARPTLTPYVLQGASAGVIIAPGGGYAKLCFDREGTDIARWANSIGMSAFVLKYRVPERPWIGFGGHTALMDAQRAMSFVRSKAADFGLATNKIGFMGFSAGAHLTAYISTAYGNRTYERIDAIDDVSCRPDFSLLIYPWAMVDSLDNPKLKFNVTEDTPPAFISQAEDDFAGIENSLFYYWALKKAGAGPSEMHAWPSGSNFNHGYGRCTIYPKTHVTEACEWPRLAASYLHARGITEQTDYGQQLWIADEKAVPEFAGKAWACATVFLPVAVVLFGALTCWGCGRAGRSWQRNFVRIDMSE